jgi:methane/ammonia monooxygenase subunit B
MNMVAQIHNLSDQPIQIGEFTTANLRFINPAAGLPAKDQTDTMVAAKGLTVDDAKPIQPGETRTVRIAAADALWETEKLEGLFRDADSRMGGLLFLYDASGKRYVTSVSTAVIPKFD